MVAHSCNPSYSGGVNLGLWFEASLGKKLVRLLSQQTIQEWQCKPVITATWKA
jgi:hypothetical protein